jgi:hypothetical protein
MWVAGDAREDHTQNGVKMGRADTGKTLYGLITYCAYLVLLVLLLIACRVRSLS